MKPAPSSVGCNSDTAAVKARHGDQETIALIAQSIFSRYLTILKDKISRVGRSQPHLVFQGAHGQARCILLY